MGYRVETDGSATLAFTAPGDANLDGQVNLFDLVAVDGGGRYNAGTSGAAWAEGDSDYNGRVDVFDLLALESSGAYGGGPISVAGGAWQRLTAAAPAGRGPGPSRRWPPPRGLDDTT